MADEPEAERVQSEKEEENVENTGIEEDVGYVENEEIEDGGEEYSSLGSHDDPEKKRNYKEYIRLEKEISCQNEILERLKSQIREITCKPCPTRCEQNDLKSLHCCLEQEMQKLRCLINKAMSLQNFGFQKRCKEFPLVTTFDEDNMDPNQHTCKTLEFQSLKTPATHEFGSCWKASNSEVSSGFDKSCSCLQTTERGHKGMGGAEENELLREIFDILTECNKNNGPQQKKQQSSVCKKTDSLEKIKNKINCIQQTMNNLVEKFSCNTKKGLHSIKSCPQQINVESASTVDTTRPLTKADKFQSLEGNYLHLLTEFSKKDEKLKELTKKLKNACGKCGSKTENVNDGSDTDKSELHLLRSRINDMKEEQVEFKCLMREQSLQLDEYRNKYISAQQQVEEQRVLLEKLNMNNKRIEKQINLEIKEIRAKFQEKLSELLQFPKLLENEQVKLAQAYKDKEKLENKLVIVCKELKSLKSKKDNNNHEDCKPQLQKCQHELSVVNKKLEEVQQQRDMFCENLRATMEDLDTLRSESAKIIARTKERSELIKQEQQKHIDNLERQLAQCRATACLSVSDRETVIREMQGQLNTLSYSFDAAQKQIKTLRNHIAYMSNESSFTAKC